MHTDVLIIGGGLAGLACAIGLRDSGLGVTLVERSSRLGGRACSWVDEKTGDTVDIGPHILLSEYPNMLRFLDMLGTRDRIHWHRSKFLTLVNRGHPVVIRSHRLPPPLHFMPSLIKAPPISFKDSRSNARVTWFTMKSGEEDVMRLDATNARDFLQQMGVTSKFLEWFWASASMSIMNVPLEKCSAGALVRFYRILLGHALKMGIPTTGLSELFVPQASRMIEACGGRVLMESEAKSLKHVDGAVTGVRLADGTDVPARYCVAAIPPQHLQPLLPTEWVNHHRVFSELSAFAPDPYISSYIWFEKKLTREQNWARVWSPDNLNYDFYDLSNIRDGWSDRPSVIASNIIYSHRANRMSDDEIIGATVSELTEFLPQAAKTRILHARVHRIPMAIPCPYPGTERKRPPAETPIRRLFLAGDWTRTGMPACMESAVRSGWLAAEQVLTETGRPRRLVDQIRAPEGIMGLVWRYAQRGAQNNSSSTD